MFINKEMKITGRDLRLQGVEWWVSEENWRAVWTWLEDISRLRPGHTNLIRIVSRCKIKILRNFFHHFIYNQTVSFQSKGGLTCKYWESSKRHIIRGKLESCVDLVGRFLKTEEI